MNKRERKKFIRQLCDNVRDDLLKESVKYPKEWDGHELRERIKDAYSQVVIKGVMSISRKREYNNFVICNNLI